MTQNAPSPEAVRDALRRVIDPEVGKDIVSLGLVYGVHVDGGEARVDFTLTTPGCPLQAVMLQAVEAAAAAVPGVERVVANLVWEPRWNPGMMDPDIWKH